MKTGNSTTLCTIAGTTFLFALTLFSVPAPSAALAFEKAQGQDKAGKNCERIDGPESSTFGKCENICKGKDVTRDAENNRWVCKASKAVVNRAPVGQVTGEGKAQQTTTDQSPKRQAGNDAKPVKVKK